MSEEKKEITQVASGRIKEKNLGDRFAESFLSEDTRTVKNYILWDVLIPAIKNGIADVIIGGIEMALFGSKSGRSNRNTGGRSNVSYSSYYGNNSRYDSSNRVDRNSRNPRSGYNDILLDTRGDVEEVILQMEELIDRYGEATVADLYSLVGITATHTDNKWGWRDARDLHYRRSGRGFVLDFAQPLYLD